VSRFEQEISGVAAVPLSSGIFVSSCANGGTMNTQVSEERFITNEFAESLKGKKPSPYLRLHDPVQKWLFGYSAAAQNQPNRENAYTDKMIHFWREISLAGMPRLGYWMDQIYALLFEATFDLAESEPDWALDCLDQKTRDKWPWGILARLAHLTQGRKMSHSSLVEGLGAIYAPWRERDADWKDERCVAASGSVWFWAALLSAAGVPEDHALWEFRCALASSSSSAWDDRRLHTRLIREAPVRAEITPRIDLMDHPILRIARLKYVEGSIEQTHVLRFLNQRCIQEGFESEEDCFGSDLRLGQWVRDAREWATQLLQAEPEPCETMFETSGSEAVEALRKMFRTELGRPEVIDHLDATAALMRWANRRRGLESSKYRAERWEYLVEVVDAALWLGWLFPRRTVPGSAKNRE
jgi:hypothetical protein